MHFLLLPPILLLTSEQAYPVVDAVSSRFCAYSTVQRIRSKCRKTISYLDLKTMRQDADLGAHISPSGQMKPLPGVMQLILAPPFLRDDTPVAMVIASTQNLQLRHTLLQKSGQLAFPEHMVVAHEGSGIRSRLLLLCVTWVF